MTDIFFQLPPKLEKTFLRWKRKYGEDFLTSYNTLANLGKKREVEGDRQSLLKLINDVNHLLDPRYDHTWKEVDGIRARMAFAEERFKTIIETVNADKVNADAINAQLEAQGLKTDDLLRDSEILLEALKKQTEEATEPEKEEPTLKEQVLEWTKLPLKEKIKAGLGYLTEEKPGVGQKFIQAAFGSVLGTGGRVTEAIFRDQQTNQKKREEARAAKDAKARAEQSVQDEARQEQAGRSAGDRAKAAAKKRLAEIKELLKV